MVDADGNFIPRQNRRRSIQSGPVVIRKGRTSIEYCFCCQSYSPVGITATALTIESVGSVELSMMKNAYLSKSDECLGRERAGFDGL
jgi:hypothetical protein